MSLISITLAAALIGSPFNVEGPTYNEKEEICLTRENYSNSIEKVKVAKGKVRGEVTYFFIEKIPFKDKRGEQLWLRKGEVHYNFMRLVNEARRKGFKFGVNSAFRSWEHQTRLWKKAPEVAANPYKAGERSHMTGYAVDFSGTYIFIPFEKIERKWFSEKWAIPVKGGYRLPTKFYWWLRKNSKKYGFKQTVPDEPWHWKYIGNEE